MIGIYKIENLVNHKVYIGKSTHIKQRFQEHFSELNKNKHKNKYLQSSWNKYGVNNFSFEIIEECSKELLNEKEKIWIEHYGGANSKQTYNYTFGGDGGNWNDEMKMKASIRQKGKVNNGLRNYDRTNPEYRKHLSKVLLGKKKTKEHAKHISEGRKGIVFTEEQKRKISNSKKGVSTSLKGRKKMEKDGIVKWVEPDLIPQKKVEGWKEYHTFFTGNYVRVGSWNKGIPMTEQAKNNLREKNLGKKLSDETKHKMSIARKNCVWINNGFKNKRINKQFAQDFLNSGWEKGRFKQ